MPRKKKNVHTSPEKAGAHNIKPSMMQPDTDNSAKMASHLFSKAQENRIKYKGQWTDEDLIKEIRELGEWCDSMNSKPNLAMLKGWLAVSDDQFRDWVTKPEKYGSKSEIIGDAVRMIESTTVDRSEKYPTGNIFLLKSSFGYKDSKSIDITSGGDKLGDTAEEVKERLKKLGLEK